MDYKRKVSLYFITACFFFSIAHEKALCSEPVLSKGQTIYVPAYSHIYSGDQEHKMLLAVTLSIRNTDMKHSMRILSVDYYDTKGKLIRKYVGNPVSLKALESTRYVVKYNDTSGGSGANFIVKWESAKAMNAPMVESIMIGAQTQQGISFTSKGQAIKEHQ
ncbi:MAG TPA: DUF3124 domain-containing protein [Syntrophorhabdaceae bacterium]|nr:MAG: hypothetical protein BWY28_01188 [bacterium ADurb.Bin236]HPN99052.1 DUF3124 domain-containing protein [Syntrophorhabdaceae bacterium]